MLRLTLIFFMTAFLFACSDPCDDVNCNSNGTCDDGTCLCDDWYEGSNCETETRTKFLGTWNSTSNCVDSNGTGISPNWTFESSANVNQFIFEASEFYTGILFTATLSDDNNAVLETFQPGTPGEINGSVEFINESRVTITLTPTGFDTCIFDLTK